PNVNLGKPAIIKCFQGGMAKYKTVPYTNAAGKIFHLPFIWSNFIPTVEHGWVPMTSLLENFMILRGYSTSNFHTPAQIKNMRGSNVYPIINGVVADESQRPYG